LNQQIDEEFKLTEVNSGVMQFNQVELDEKQINQVNSTKVRLTKSSLLDPMKTQLKNWRISQLEIVVGGLQKSKTTNGGAKTLIRDSSRPTMKNILHRVNLTTSFKGKCLGKRF